MFVSAIGRLVWKEYRVQRALWFLVLGLLLVLQLLLRLAFFSSTGSGPSFGVSADELWATWAMWLLAFCALVIFLVASVAIGFAGEREERTCDLVLHHAPSPWAVLSAKLGICIGGSLALYVCGAFVALALGRADSQSSYVPYQLFYVDSAIGSDLVARLIAMLVLLAWCLFGSLLSQRVLTSIPTMAIGWVLTGWIPLMGVAGFLSVVTRDAGVQGDRFILMYSFLWIALAMMGVDVWLAYRWTEGKYVDLEFLGNYGDFWPNTWGEVLGRKSRVHRMPRGIELDESERRAWQRMVWQERQRNVIPRWLTIAICLAILAVNPVQLAAPASYGTPSLHDVVVCLLALAMGILSFRSDGEGQPVRFLANHGASAGMIWKAKQAVWLVRAIVTPAVLLVLVAIRDSMLFSYPSGLIERHLWLILLSYGCGQLSAMLLGRAILAAITGATAAAVMFLWLELMRSLQLPQWWSLGIPAMAPLLATWVQARSWLLGESTWSHKIRLSAVIIGLPLITCLTLAAYRVVEVDRAVNRIERSWRNDPVMQSPYNWQYQHETGNLTMVQPSDDRSSRPRLLAIAEMSGNVRLKLSEQDKRLADEVTAAFLGKSVLLHESLVEIVDQPTEGDPTEPKKKRASDSPSGQLFPVSSFERLSDLLLARARDHLQLNERDSAFEVCLAHLGLCRAMARGPFNPCWEAGAAQERRVLELIVEWANHRQVTFAEIHGAIKEIESRLRQFPTPSSAIIDELTLARRGSIVDEYARFHGATVGWQRIWLQLPWESMRRQRLWDIEARLHRGYLSYLTDFYSLGPDFVSRTYGPKSEVENAIPVGKDYLQPVAELQASTWGADVALAEDRSGFVRDRIAAVNAALTRLGIIAYRKQYGKMPADLDALFGIVRQWNFKDPWSSGRFDYRTNCLVSQGNKPSVLEAKSDEDEAAARRIPPASRFVFPIPAVPTDQNAPEAPAEAIPQQGRGR